VVAKETRHICEIFTTYNIKLNALSDECMAYSQPVKLEE